MDMRDIYAHELGQLMEENFNIVAIDADLARANGVLRLRERFPERAIDVGVAEQNMVGVAAGLSSYGFIPFIGSFAPFATRRVADQIMISVCYARQNVKIIGSDPGISAELNGGTHMSFEDIAVLRSFPNLVICEPADGEQLRQAIRQIALYKGPVYLRLYRKERPPLVGPEYQFDLFSADLLREGGDVTIAASGILLSEAVDAAKLLAEEGISAEILGFHTIKPLDKTALLRSVEKTGCLVTAENHNIIGGLRSAAAECLAEFQPAPMESVGIQDEFGEVGRFNELQKRYGLTAANIMEAARRAISRKKTLGGKKQ